jgi:transcriptional regulator with XRE-family HTH domain
LQQYLRVVSVTGAQLRAARALLNVSVAELAETTGLAVNTIRRAEGTNGEAPITAANMKLLLTVLEQAGVLFIPAETLGPGVRLASPDPAKMRLRKRDTRPVE